MTEHCNVKKYHLENYPQQIVGVSTFKLSRNRGFSLEPHVDSPKNFALVVHFHRHVVEDPVHSHLEHLVLLDQRSSFVHLKKRDKEGCSGEDK